MDVPISQSAATIRHMPKSPVLEPQATSVPSSPRSSALPSPPDSPSGSVSSFPSVSSSFFFSSAAASPHHPGSGTGSQPQSDRAKDSTNALIIPSLTLPEALRRPTPYGQTLGSVKLVVLGSKGSGKTSLCSLLVEDNDDIVETGSSEHLVHGSVIRASTDWVEHRDSHGLEKFEPAKNVEVYEFPGYDQNDDVRKDPCYR